MPAFFRARPAHAPQHGFAAAGAFGGKAFAAARLFGAPRGVRDSDWRRTLKMKPKLPLRVIFR